MAMEVAGDIPLPSSFEVWHPPCEDQGNMGNCVAQTGAAYMECIDHLEGLEHLDRSVGYIYFADASSSAGMVMRDACLILLKEGDVYRSVWERLSGDNEDDYRERRSLGPEITGQAKRIGAFIRLKTLEEAKLFMYKYKLPLFMAGQVDKFISPIMRGGHAVLGIGWDDSAKKKGRKGCLHYLNSWGTKNMWTDDDGTAWCDFDELEEAWGFMPIEVKSFPDIEGHWAEQSIKKAAEAGLLMGHEDGTFRPEETLTRAEMAAVLERLMTKMADPILG